MLEILTFLINAGTFNPSLYLADQMLEIDRYYVVGRSPAGYSQIIKLEPLDKTGLDENFGYMLVAETNYYKVHEKEESRAQKELDDIWTGLEATDSQDCH